MNRIAFFFFIILSLILRGQVSPFSYSLNKETGLQSDMIYDVFQDKKGFTWFGTSKGISRFDGHQIKNFNNQHTTRRKSASNINEDNFGRIWFQNFSGEISYIENNIQHRFPFYKANGFIKYGILNNQLVIAGKEGIKVYNIKTFKLLKHYKIDLSSVIHSAVVDDTFYLIGNKIQAFTTDGRLQTIVSSDEFENKITAPVPATSKNKLIVFSKFSSTYLVLDKKGYLFHKLPFSTTFTQNANYIDDEFWLCTTKGIYRYHPTKKTLTNYYPETNVSYVIKTNTNNHWISTINQGAMFVENWNSNLIKTNFKPIQLASSGNKLFYSTNRDEIYTLNENNISELIYKGNSDHAIYPLIIDEINKQLLFTSSKFTILSSKKKLESLIPVKKIIQLDAKYYFICASTWNGVIYTNPNLKSEWDEEFEGYASIFKDGIYYLPIVENENGRDCVVDSSSKTIYFLTNYGLKKFNQKKVFDLKSTNNINFIEIEFLNNQLFLVGDDEKLYTHHPDKIKAVIFPNNIGNSDIQKIKKSGNQLLFLKNQAIYAFKINQNAIQKKIDLPIGLGLYDIVETNSTFYISTNKGIISFSNEQKSSNTPINLFIDQVFVNEKQVQYEALDDLRYTENNIDFLYSIISPIPNNQYTVSFKIDDNPWTILPNSSRVLRFSSLSYGNHTILIQIKNGNQILEKKLSLYINAPFWQKWWFILIIVFSITIGIYFYFLNTIKKNNKKNKKAIEQLNLEKSLNQSKLKSLKSQMNPHFFFNALNTLQSYILSNEKKEAVSYLSKFSQLTRSILEMSDKESITIAEEIKTLTNYLELEKARFSTDFSYSLNIDTNLDTTQTHIPTLLLQPYVENAIKHGLLHKQGDKKLDISFTIQECYIVIHIEDNGIGREKSRELNVIKNKNHTSFATQSLDERIKLLNLSLDSKITLNCIDKKNHQGTIISLSIPKNYQP